MSLMRIMQQMRSSSRRATANDRNVNLAGLGGRYHSLDFLINAHLQLGQLKEAKRIVDLRNGLAQFLAEFRYTGHTAFAAIPVRYAFEREAWAEAAKLTIPKTPYPQAEAISWFGRALGAARSNDLESAKKTLVALQGLKKRLENSNEPYWAGQVHIQELATLAWISSGEKRRQSPPCVPQPISRTRAKSISRWKIGCLP